MKYIMTFIILAMVCVVSNAQVYYKNEADISGYGSYQLDELEEQSHLLSDLVEVPQGSDFFTVINIEPSGVLAYTNPLDGVPTQIELAEEQVNNQYDFYFLIIKTLDVNQNVRYKTNLKLPSQIGEIEISDIMVSALNNMAQSKMAEISAMNNEYKDADIQGIIELKNKLNQILNGEEIPDILELAGFRKVLIESTDILTQSGEEDNYLGALLSIYDYQGFKYNDNNLIDGIASSASVLTKSTEIFLTGVEYGLNSVYQSFEESDAKFKLIFYFDFEVALADPGLKSDKSSDEMRSSQSGYIYYKSANNLSKTEAQQEIELAYQENWNNWTGNPSSPNDTENEAPIADSPSCSLDWKWGKKCIYFHVRDNPGDYGLASATLTASSAMLAGFLDGFLGTLEFVTLLANPKSLFEQGLSIANSLNPVSPDFIVWQYLWETAVEAYENDKWIWEVMAEDVLSTYNTIKNALESINYENIKNLAIKIYQGIENYLNKNFAGSVIDLIAYNVGVVAFELVLTYFTAGTSLALKAGKFMKSLGSSILSAGDNILINNLRSGLGKSVNDFKSLACRVFNKGCFVKSTPVLMANTFEIDTSRYPFNISNAKSLAVAAAMPIIAVPIQEVQLLEYVVAHKTVNSDYGLTVSVNEDFYPGLKDSDTYTSDQQRMRDKYEINDTDWSEVVFEEVNGSSTAKLALHGDWINQKGYQVEAVVEMNLPEQGIRGPFKITSIKHILPQKKPVDEDDDDYDYKPVTGLFIHEASDVWKIKFDNDEELGITHKHPIFSATKGDWELAGNLEIGEVVLTKNGGAKVVSKEPDQIQEVYNLEVKEYHNFLVNASGIVVHNTGNCVNDLFEFYKFMFRNPDDVAHILRGKVNSVGLGSGCHHKSAFDMGTARIRPGSVTTPPNQHGVYEAFVDVKDAAGEYRPKTLASTFFPDDWDQMKIMENITHAWENYIPVPGTSNTFKGFSIDGNIEIHMYLRPDGSIQSAFPKL